jgi:hypothetical protein
MRPKRPLEQTSLDEQYDWNQVLPRTRLLLEALRTQPEERTGLQPTLPTKPIRDQAYSDLLDSDLHFMILMTISYLSYSME